MNSIISHISFSLDFLPHRMQLFSHRYRPYNHFSCEYSIFIIPHTVQLQRTPLYSTSSHSYFIRNSITSLPPVHPEWYTTIHFFFFWANSGTIERILVASTVLHVIILFTYHYSFIIIRIFIILCIYSFIRYIYLFFLLLFLIRNIFFGTHFFGIVFLGRRW